MFSPTILVDGKERNIDNWRKDRPDHRDLLLTAPAPSVRGRQVRGNQAGKKGRLPKKVDLRRQCPRTEDQADIGSCTANASTSAMEFLYKKAGLKVVQFSRLFVYYYTRKIENTPPTVDSGAYLRNVMKALSFYGAASERIWPYITRRFSDNPSFEAVKDAQKHKITAYYRCPDLESLKHCLAQGFPAAGGFAVPRSIESRQTMQTGRVAMPRRNESIIGGHAVLFVGYDDSQHHLVFQNSWGTKWGARGFGYLPYQYVTSRLADDFWTIRRETIPATER